MANLYGRVQGRRGEAHRLGNSSIEVEAKTWTGRVRVYMTPDNKATIDIEGIEAEIRSGGRSNPGVLTVNAGRKTTLGEIDPSLSEILGFLQQKFRGDGSMKGVRFPQKEWDAFVAMWERKNTLKEV